MKLSSFKKAAYNPRRITPEERAKLAKSIAHTGDLSGLVLNKRTNTIVGGHQRISTFEGKKTKMVTKPHKDNFGTIAVGHLEVELDTGKIQVPVRIVDWDRRTEKLANIAANNHGGEFDNQKLGKLLAELDNKKFDIELTGFSEGEFQTLIRRSLDAEKVEEKYVRKLSSPIYKPHGKKPKLSQIYDRTKTEELQASIRKANLPADVTDFLMAAAERHTKFHFANAAEYYAQSPKKVQKLMEDCAMVIVDFDKAIEHGYLRLTKEIQEMVKEDE